MIADPAPIRQEALFATWSSLRTASAFATQSQPKTGYEPITEGESEQQGGLDAYPRGGLGALVVSDVTPGTATKEPSNWLG